MFKENNKKCIRFLSIANCFANRFARIWNDIKLTPISSFTWRRCGTDFNPNYLLFGPKLNAENFSEKFDAKKLIDLNKQLKHINNLLNHFWNCWRSEHVPSLCKYRNVYQKEKHTYVGDVVNVYEEKQLRQKWRLRRITNLLKSTQLTFTCSDSTIEKGETIDTPEKVWNMLKVNNKNTRATSMSLFGIFVLNFEHISHVFLVILLLTLSK